MGPFPPVISCQVAVTPPFNLLGGKPGTHVDGGWNGVVPDSAEEIDMATCRPKDAAKYFGENDEKRGTNDGLLWMNPERTLSYGSYTALVGVALNDQHEPGNGQLGILKGTMRMSKTASKRRGMLEELLGPEGPGWPRIGIGKSGKPYANGLPDDIRKIAEQRAEAGAPTENWPWPELTPVLLAREMLSSRYIVVLTQPRQILVQTRA